MGKKDTNKIIELYKQGKTKKSIADELRVCQVDVRYTIKDYKIESTQDSFKKLNANFKANKDVNNLMLSCYR